MERTSNVISGTIGYAFVTPENMSYTYNPKGNYVLKLFPDDDSMKLIEELGGLHLLREPTEKDQGPFINLNRRSEKPIFDKTSGKPTGNLEPNTPPFIHGVEDGTMIGAGSTAKVQFRHYKGRANKVWFELEGLRIVNLVPFEGKRSEKKDLLA